MPLPMTAARMAERAPRAAAGLAGLLLPVPFGLLPLLLPPSGWTALVLLLALPLHLAGAAWLLGYRAEASIGGLLRRRASSVLLLLMAISLGLATLLAWPVWQLHSAASLGASLLASVAVALVGLAVWRAWPALVLPLIDTPGLASATDATRGPMAAWRAGRVLASADPSAGRGLLATVLVLLLLLGALGLGLGDGLLPAALRWVALPLWSLLLAPLFSFALVALVEPARLASRAASAPLPAAAVGDPQLLLPVGLDATMRLYAVARTGRVELALAELEMGADPHALPDPSQRDQRTLAMLAAVLGDLRLLRALIQRGVDLNRRHAGLTPLLAATRDSLIGRPEAVMTLLANGADPRVTDAEGRTPLHFAVLLDDPDVAAQLLDANAQIDACNRDGFSPLGVACAAGNWRMAKFLLDRRAKPEPTGGQPVLLAAVAGEDDPTGLMLLQKFKANVNARGRLGRSPLMNACLAGNRQIVEALLAAGAAINAHDEHGVTPLLEAARAGATELLPRLAEAHADPTACDQNGRNALVLACGSPQASAETIRLLLSLGVDPDQRAADGRRALEVAISSGRWPLVAALDASYVLPATLDEPAAMASSELPEVAEVVEPELPFRARLHDALLDGRLAEVDRLLGQTVDGDACAELFDMLGPRIGRDLRQRLVVHVDAEGRDVAGALRLWRCLDEADGDGIDCLLARGATVGGRGGLARYLVACLARRLAPADGQARACRLLASGADGFADCAGDPPLTLAIRLGWIDLVRELLAAGANPQALDARGESALMLACVRRCEQALPLLLRHGAQPEAMTADGRTARGVALARGEPTAIDWLDWTGWQLPGRVLRETDLVNAAALGDRAAVRRLVALGLPVDASDGKGASALLRACGSGHAAVVADLLAHGADPARAADSGATCLSAAVSRRQLGVIATLLAHGVAADQPLPGAITPLMVAAALGFPDVCRALLDAGAAPAATDQAGNGVLHALAQHGFSAREASRVLACWDMLLAAGAPADGRNADGLSPLLLLLGARMEAGANADEDCLHAQVERLLRVQADLAARDARGFTPLHLAALHGQFKVLRRLLEAGASREARDVLNRLPHDIAVMRGFVDIARELAPVTNAPPPSLARLLRDPSQ